MPVIHLRQPALIRKPGFAYSTYGPFTKNKERIQHFKEKGGSRSIYQNGLDKSCF